MFQKYRISLKVIYKCQGVMKKTIYILLLEKWDPEDSTINSLIKSSLGTRLQYSQCT
jgi:hypothetical protein